MKRASSLIGTRTRRPTRTLPRRPAATSCQAVRGESPSASAASGTLYASRATGGRRVVVESVVRDVSMRRILRSDAEQCKITA